MSMRKFSRVNFNVIARVTAGGRSFNGTVINLSMSGMLLGTDERLPEGTVVEISLTLMGTEPEISVVFGGKVKRITEEGIGFQFDRIDLDSYTHLKNIISYNMADAEKVMDEIYTNIDDKISSGI